MTWKKFAAWSLGFVLFVAVGTLATLKLFENIEESSDSRDTTQNYTKDRMGSPEAFIEVSNAIEDGMIPSEEDFQQQIHMMSHQKVHASDKWGALELTSERVDNLLRVLDETKYEHEKLYRHILTQWKEGDFHDAVNPHNDIWDMQGGTIGSADRLLTDSEELEFTTENFRNKF
ncbi:DUF6241 domain-containing protein [Rummeliibacillus sp. JY-2-4R]